MPVMRDEPPGGAVSKVMADLADAVMAGDRVELGSVLDMIPVYADEQGISRHAATLAVVGALREAYRRTQQGYVSSVAICPLCMPACSMRADEVESHLLLRHRNLSVLAA